MFEGHDAALLAATCSVSMQGQVEVASVFMEWCSSIVPCSCGVLVQQRCM